MDSFEAVVAAVLQAEGYWVRTGLKVELTKEEKRQIGRPSSPRWELDLVGYRGSANEFLVVECKSYFDSTGVTFAALTGADAKYAARFKLFNEPTLREVVFARLKHQMVESGACAPEPTVRFGLAAGRVASDRDREALRKHFAEQSWTFWDEEWLRGAIGRIAEGGYEDHVAAVVAKMLLRDS